MVMIRKLRGTEYKDGHPEKIRAQLRKVCFNLLTFGGLASAKLIGTGRYIPDVATTQLDHTRFIKWKWQTTYVDGIQNAT